MMRSDHRETLFLLFNVSIKNIDPILTLVVFLYKREVTREKNLSMSQS